MSPNSKIFVSGHRGLVGSALVRELTARGFTNILTVDRNRVDLTSSHATQSWFQRHEPEFVFHAAARVGGILANSAYPADFMDFNLRIQCNVLHAARRAGVSKLIFFGSACAYPKHAETPILEDSLLTGALEPSNECYAIAKIAGFKLCQAYRKQYGCNFISCFPTNLYGPGDNYHPTDSHVIPGMIRKIHHARATSAPFVTLWGTGMPRREFLYSEDLARAAILLMEKYDSSDLINIGTAYPYHLRDIAAYVSDAVSFKGRIEWDDSKPDGTPDRWMDSGKIQALGWKPSMDIHEGLGICYGDFLKRHGHEA